MQVDGHRRACIRCSQKAKDSCRSRHAGRRGYNPTRRTPRPPITHCMPLNYLGSPIGASDHPTIYSTNPRRIGAKEGERKRSGAQDRPVIRRPAPAGSAPWNGATRHRAQHPAAASPVAQGGCIPGMTPGPGPLSLQQCHQVREVRVASIEPCRSIPPRTASGQADLELTALTGTDPGSLGGTDPLTSVLPYRPLSQAVPTRRYLVPGPAVGWLRLRQRGARPVSPSWGSAQDRTRSWRGCHGR